MNFSQSNSLTINDGTATIEISDSIGGSRVITSSGSVLNRIRKDPVSGNRLLGKIDANIRRRQSYFKQVKEEKQEGKNDK